MPSLITTPSGEQIPLRPLMMYDHMLEYKKAHDLMGWNWQATFDYFYTYGHVIKSPDYMLVGEQHRQHPDTWFVWWLSHSDPSANAVQLALKLMPYHLPNISFARALKGHKEERTYSTDRMLRLTKVRP